MPRWGWLATLFCAIAAHSVAAERTWTSSDGRTMRAEFVRESGGEVTFLKDGQLFTLPLARLSEKDQQNVRDLAAGKQLPNEPAPAPSQATAPANPPAAEAPKAIDATKQPVNVNRVWTDKDGNQQTAKFVRMTGGNVVLVSRANRNIVLDFYKLTSEDQEFLRGLLTAQGKEAQIPLPPPEPVEPPTENAAPAAAAPSRPSFPQPSFPQPSFPPPPVPGSGSSLLEEMRARQQQQHQEFLQRIEQQRQESQQRNAELRQKSQEDFERRMQEATERARPSQNQAVVDLSHGGPATAPPTMKKLDAQTVVKIRQFIVIGVVVIGVLGMLAVVVFVAITIAAASSAKRKYS